MKKKKKKFHSISSQKAAVILKKKSQQSFKIMKEMMSKKDPTAGALPPAWCSLFLWASRYWLKGFWSEGPTLGTELTSRPPETSEQRSGEERQRGGRQMNLPVQHQQSNKKRNPPVRSGGSSSSRRLFLPHIPVSAAGGPHCVWGASGPGAPPLSRCCEREQAAEKTEATPPPHLLLYDRLSIGACVSPFNEEVSRHDVITFTTIAAFWVGKTWGRTHVLIRQ